MSASEPSTRASAWEWTQAAILAVNLVWTTLQLGGFRPETMVVSFALTVALVAVHFGGLGWSCGALMKSDAGAGSAGHRTLHPAGWLLLPFLVYGALNVLFVTPVRWLGWLDWIGYAQMIGVF